MLLVHQAVPHSHHAHDEAITIEAKAHHHSHDDTAHHPTDKEHHDEDDNGFLALLFGSHIHTFHTNDSQLRSELKPQIQSQHSSYLILTGIEHIRSVHYPLKKEKLIPYYSIGYHHPYLTTPSLRGPPTLG
jgi:hypothetical protein